MSEPSDKVIEYAPRQKLHLSRRAKHVTLIVVAVLIAAILAPRAYRQMKLRMLVSEMATYTMPADLPVLDTRALGPELSQIHSRQPPARFAEIFPQRRSILFVGELKDSAGKPWLVQVGLDSESLVTGNFLSFVFRAVPRNDLSQPQSTTAVSVERPEGWFALLSGRRARIFPGERDVSNPGHITIKAILGDEVEIIDGYLNDDGTMTLELREPPTTSPG